MRILLDTHILIWSFYRSSRLRAPVRAQIEDPANAIFFSAASLWEIAIKAALERPDFDVDPDRLLEEAIKAGFTELPITSRLAITVRDLPFHHTDPFDRLLVAQALAEPCILLTADRTLQPYSDLVRLV